MGKEMRDSQVEVLKFVFPEHANPRGKLYGGRMVKWVMEAGLMSASRHANRMVILASMEDLDFLAPVEVGEIVYLNAKVEYTGQTSMEVGVEVRAEHPPTGTVKYPCSAHLTFVAMDEKGSPTPVPPIIPSGDWEKALYEAGEKRYFDRKERIARRMEKATDVEDIIPPHSPNSIEVAREIFPEDTVYLDYADAGSVMMTLDVTGGILCMRYAHAVNVTASIDAVDFYSPIRVGEIMVVKAALNWAGRTSMEVGMKVLAENPLRNEKRHTCTAFFTFVSLDENGKPTFVPSYEPRTTDEKKRFREAEERRQKRLARSRQLKSILNRQKGESG